MKYQIAEKFKSIQGEGLYAGTPMAFIRFVGCSVGKKICQHCDTVFEQMLPWQGGGEFTVEELNEWTKPYDHICLTGGEPLDQDLVPIFERMTTAGRMVHIETSGTKPFWKVLGDEQSMWICVSPKPGFKEDLVMRADEVKVIVPGLGSDESLTGKTYPVSMTHGGPITYQPKYWPKLEDALRWADMGKLVYIQPRNGRFDIDHNNLRIVQDILIDHPNLRLSTQMHKILKVQ